VHALGSGLARLGIGEALTDRSALRVLEAAALLGAIGGSKKRRNGRASRALLARGSPPPGWTPEEMRDVALLVHSGGGANRHLREIDSRELSEPERRKVAELLAVLRLATALTSSSPGAVRVKVDPLGDLVRITTTGYVETKESASRVSAATFVLERVMGRHFVVRPSTARPRPALASLSRRRR
jgi:exopolyphosphatase/pppGpp-phosphohydrolase